MSGNQQPHAHVTCLGVCRPGSLLSPGSHPPPLHPDLIQFVLCGTRPGLNLQT